MFLILVCEQALRIARDSNDVLQIVKEERNFDCTGYWSKKIAVFAYGLVFIYGS